MAIFLSTAAVIASKDVLESYWTLGPLLGGWTHEHGKTNTIRSRLKERHFLRVAAVIPNEPIHESQ